MRFLYYTGCVIPYRAPNYDLSSRRILEHFGVELVDMLDAGCCGIYVRQVDEFKALVLSARIWTTAEAANLDILSPCPGCVSTLTHVRDELVADERLKGRVNAALAQVGRTFKGTGRVKHLLRVLDEDIGLETIRAAIVHPLTGDLAAHYGCHLVRPAAELKFQDPELPQILDQLIEITGARSLDYPDKMGCCGMNVHGNDGIRSRLAGHKLLDVQAAGAQALVMACPACYLAMGLNQPIVEKSWARRFDLPVVHLPQLLGLALGLDPNALGLNLNRPKVDLEMLGARANGKETA
jgi:heterodisulfide reductase subunit B